MSGGKRQRLISLKGYDQIGFYLWKIFNDTFAMRSSDLKMSSFLVLFESRSRVLCILVIPVLASCEL